jgi:hypothetical protein
MENVENFSCKSRIFLVLALFWSFFVIFGLNTEFVPEFSGGRSLSPISYETRGIDPFLICNALVCPELPKDSALRLKNRQNST